MDGPQSQLQFGVIFIIVDTIVWNNFTKDMKPKDFMNQTTFKGAKYCQYLNKI